MSAADAIVGRSFGEFALREKIGEGGFGVVYRATQVGLEREVVVKVLHERMSGLAAASERFLREAKLASKLDHPYAAHIYAFGAEPDGLFWIAMELVRGTPLDKLLAAQGPLSLDRFVPLLDRLCEVIHTAHEQGIVHRDIKPANIMVLARAGRLLPKLLDFGIAKGLRAAPATDDDDVKGMDETLPGFPLGSAADDALAHTMQTGPQRDEVGPLTKRGTLMGSPHYMAPEQWLDAGAATQRTDLYALGVVAYECLTGHKPFNGATLTQIANAHAKEPPPPLGRQFPAALDAVLATTLAKQASGRYANALEFATAFRNASGLASEPVSLPAIDPRLRDTAMATAPQPIADAVVALAAARNAHQARDAIAQLTRTVTRYLALIAIACRSRATSGTDHSDVAAGLRALHRGTLPDASWAKLAALLARAWIDRRDAYPVPELVDVFEGSALLDDLEALATLRERAARSEEALVELLADAVARVSRVLRAIAFLAHYPLVVMSAPGAAEQWMGARRAQRMTVPIRGKDLTTGVPALLDPDGAVVLALAPLFTVAAPTPGAPFELFLFEGRDARGAKLVALPGDFEHHDDAMWDWFRAQLATSLDDALTPVDAERTPYRGLHAFSADDSARFFGREKQVDAFVNRLKASPLLAVVGRSGAGKSSFVHAGVVPALGWRAITMRPGASPLATFAARLEHEGFAERAQLPAIARDGDALGALLRADAAARGPIVLVIDQLEEMFTLCSDEAERAAFADAIAAVARTAEDPVRVIVTLRDDFLVRTEQYAPLRNRIGYGLQLLTVPAADDLLRIVVEPARRAGYDFDDPELPNDMVRGVRDQPGALALISFAAAELWELRDRQFRQLTRAAYKTLGGVGGALARHAEATLESLTLEQRTLARTAFRHLVTSLNTRAVLARKDLRQLLGGGPHAETVIEKLVAARLFVASENETGAESVEIIHEALLSAWPRLVEWRREDAEGARFREQLRSAAAQWQERGRDKGLLWRGDALAEFTRWRARHEGHLTDVEAAFSDASLAEASRARRGRRLVLAGAFAALALVVVGLIVFNSRIAAERATAQTAARDLRDNLEHQFEDQGRRLLLSGDPLQALAYLWKARSLGASGSAHEFLVARAVAATDGELFEVHQDNEIWRISLSSDGSRLLTAGVDHAAKVWDGRDGKLLFELPHRDYVVRATFSPDDATILTASRDGTVTLWDAATGRQRWQIAQNATLGCAIYSRDGQHVVLADYAGVLEVRDARSSTVGVHIKVDGAEYWSCAISPDGQWLAAGDQRGIVRIWDARDGRELHEIHGHTGVVWVMRFSPDATKLITGSSDGRAVLWTTATGARAQTFVHAAEINGAELSPDGTRVLTASTDHTARVWDASTGAQIALLGGHAGAVVSARYSPNGKFIVTTSGDTTAMLWDAASGTVIARWRGHRGRVFDVAFDSASTRAVTFGADGRAFAWRLAPQERVMHLGHDVGNDERSILSASFSPDGRRAAAGGPHGVRVWDAVTGRELATLHTASVVTGLRFSPDGATLALVGEDGLAALWDGRSETARALPGASGALDVPAWSADGAIVVAPSSGGAFYGWSSATAELKLTKPGKDAVNSATFDPDGNIVTTSADHVMRRWSTQGQLISERVDPDGLVNILFDPSGARALSILVKPYAKLWSYRTGRQLLELVGHLGPLLAAAWAPDGSIVATCSEDHTVQLWSAETGDVVARYDLDWSPRAVSFSPDGARLLFAGDGGHIEIHDLSRRHLDDQAFERLVRCRVPFELVGARLVGRDVDRAACD